MTKQLNIQYKNLMQNTQINVEKYIREYISELYHLSLATCNNDVPWVCEVHFAYDNDMNLYFRSLASRRHSLEIAENSRIAGNIVKQHSLDETAVGIYFEGTAKMVESRDELDIACACIKERLEVDDDILEEAKHDDGHKFYKITVQSYYIFGRFGLPHGQKYKLEWNGGKKIAR